MKPLVPTLLGVALTITQPTPAAAYQIDCAILLCLAGGFPPSEPCARAYTTMIRRITPWPIEPPLQIWRCPMGVGFDFPVPLAPLERLYRIGAVGAVPSAFPDKGQIDELMLTASSGDYGPENGTADVDISGADFEFIRSIRVFSVEYAWQRWNGGDDDTCYQGQRVRLGTYGSQGEFGWQGSSVTALPAAFTGLEHWADLGDPNGYGCPGLSKRSVFIEWRDHEGAYGFEQVDY